MFKLKNVQFEMSNVINRDSDRFFSKRNGQKMVAVPIIIKERVKCAMKTSSLPIERIYDK